MFHVQCKQCGAWTTVASLDGIGALSLCNCCPADHDHDGNANACPGAGLNHPDVACAEPAGPVACLVASEPGEECPGGHCGPAVADCTVCRPVEITFLPGSVTVPALITGG